MNALQRHHFFKFTYNQYIETKYFEEIFEIPCLGKNTFSSYPDFKDFDVDIESSKKISLNDVIKLVPKSKSDIALNIIETVFRPNFFGKKVNEITLSNNIFPILMNTHLNSLFLKDPSTFVILIALLDLYDRITRKISDHEIDKNSFVKSTKCYWFERRWGHDDVSDIISSDHLFFIESELTKTTKTNNKSINQRPSNTVYIWKTNEQDLYKIGRSSTIRLQTRVTEVARKNGLSVKSIWSKEVGACAVNFCEKELLKYGKIPKHIVGDGKTEFRYLNKLEVSNLLDKLNSFTGLDTKINE